MFICIPADLFYNFYQLSQCRSEPVATSLLFPGVLLLKLAVQPQLFISCFLSLS